MELILINVETNVSVSQKTGTEGTYVFNFVPPGAYTLRASFEGFKTSETRGTSALK